MAPIHPGRYMADLDDFDEVVVFIIGMRINRIWQFWRWLPVFVAMPRMVIELMKDPSQGLLAQPRNYMSGRVFMLVQYWRSFEQLEAYARDPKRNHLPAWRDFNRRIRNNGSVGIFHETYRVKKSEVETIYGNMPVFGLAGATGHVPVAKGSHSAAARLSVRADGDAPVDPY